MANGQTFSGGGLAAKAPRPPSSTQTDDVKRQQEEFQQMARDAGEAFQSLVIARDNQIRGGGAPGRFFALIEKEFVEGARIWKEALKFAGKDTSVVDRSLAKALDGTPKVPITQLSQKAGEKTTFLRGGVPDPSIQAVENRQRFRPNAPVVVGPQEQAVTAAGPVPDTFNPAQKPSKIRGVIDTETNQPRFATDEEIRANPNRFRPATGLKLRVSKDGDIEFATGGGELTPASTTGAQKIKRQTIEVLGNVSTLKRLLEKSRKAGKPIIGGLAAFQGFLNKTIVQFVPGLFDKDRAKFERAVKAVRQTALRVVSDETRFSESDRDFIFDLFPSVSIIGSEEEAMVKLNVLTAFFVRRLGGALTDLGIDEATVPQMTPEDIRVALESGFLDEEEAKKILRQLFPKRFTRD